MIKIIKRTPYNKSFTDNSKWKRLDKERDRVLEEEFLQRTRK